MTTRPFASAQGTVANAFAARGPFAASVADSATSEGDGADDDRVGLGTRLRQMLDEKRAADAPPSFDPRRAIADGAIVAEGRRVAKVFISPELLAQLLDLPRDVAIAGVAWDPFSHALALACESPSFAPVPVYEVPPQLVPLYERKPGEREATMVRFDGYYGALNGAERRRSVQIPFGLSHSEPEVPL